MPSELLARAWARTLVSRMSGSLSSCSHLLQRVQDLDQARVVVIERAEHGAAIQFAELGPLLVGARRAAAVDDVEARQRTHAVDAIGIAQRLVVAGLQIGPGMRDLADDSRRNRSASMPSATMWPPASRKRSLPS